MSPEEINTISIEQMSTHDINTIRCFTDGSKDAEGRVGSAYVLGTHAAENFRISDNVSILAAELEPIHAAIKAINDFSTTEMQRYIIHTDSLGTLQSLQSENPTSRPIRIANIQVSICAAMENGVEIELCWIPGHNIVWFEIFWI